MAWDPHLKATMKAKRMFTPPGFCFLPDDDPRPDMDFFRCVLTSNQYMPGGKKTNSDMRPAEEWKKVRAEVNLTIVFEAIWYFADFWGTDSYCRRLGSSLNYGTKKGAKLRAMVDTYCDARSTFQQQQQQEREAGPAPGSRLLELVDHVNELREQPNPSSGVIVTSEVWARRMEGWKQRLQEVMEELEVLYSPQLKEYQASSTSPALSHAAKIDPDGKHPISSGNGLSDKPDNASKENTPFFFDVSSTKRGPPEDDASFGNLPKRANLDTDASRIARRIFCELPDTGSCIVFPGETDDGTHKHCDPSDCKIARLFIPDYPLEDVVELQSEHGFRIGKVEARQTDMQEEMNHKTKEAAARLEAFEDQLKTMQGQLQVHQAAIATHATASTEAAPSTWPASSADSRERNLSELTAREPKEFIKAICKELNMLRAVTKSKIHQMDRQGLPDNEKKLAVSDLSWQIGKCIKVAEKGVDELM